MKNPAHIFRLCANTGSGSLPTALKRISKPSLRKYSGASDIDSVKGGLGSFIISTNQGLMTDKEAKAKNVGGEILCEVF